MNPENASRVISQCRSLDNFNFLEKPVLTWLERRSCYFEKAMDLEWVEGDPIVGHLFPILHFLNRENGAIHLTEKIHQKTRLAYLETHARELAREKWLKEILNLLQGEDIEVIPFKGCILQMQLYRNNGLRIMTDIDLLVREPQFLHAGEVLGKLGLKLHSNNGFDDLSFLMGIPLHMLPAEIKFVDNTDSSLILEIHRNLVTTPWLIPGFNIDLKEVWRRAYPATVEIDPNGLWRRILSSYDTLAALIVHEYMHGLQAMQSFLDIDLWIRNLSATWDWGEFLELVDLWKIRATTYHALSFCKHFMDTPLPDDLLKSLDPGWFSRWCLGWLITPESLLANRRTLGRRYPTLVKLALIDRLRDMVLILRKIIFPDKAWREKNLARRSLLAHWLHIWRVVRRGD
jgi:hypothetical protein